MSSSSLLWFLFYCSALALIVCFVGNKLLRALIILNEYKLQRDAPPVTWSYEDMLNIAKSKKDAQMSDAEFDMKYGAYRHELYRTTSVSRKAYDTLGRILHYIELYCIHGGRAALDRKISIVAPIFIIGDFRSGTSVLERIIEHHPTIAAFSTTHAHIWSAPFIFESIVSWLDAFRRSCGCEGFNSPSDKGMFYPHSSNNVLSRHRPMELEAIWLQCASHYSRDRHSEWQTLDSDDNPDNCRDCDLLTAAYSDVRFETYLKTSIQMLLLHRQCQRFIWKNPMHGFRIGFIRRLFPDAQFIFIARNPGKVLKSQLEMERCYCKAHYIEDAQQWRRQDMRPRPPYYNTRRSWYYLFHGQLPNDTYGHQLWPRVWPRVQPEHLAIQHFLKQDKVACATAMGIAQHDRIVRQTLPREHVLRVWHENVLRVPLQVLREIHSFLGLTATDGQRVQWLKREDFQDGKANPVRVQQSSEWEKGLSFGDETDEVYEILRPCFKHYENRTEQPIIL